MRKMLISILLASAAASPAVAGPYNWSDRQQAQEDRQQAQDDRQQARQERQAAREERAQSREDSRGDRASFAPREAVPQQQQQQPQQAPSFNRYQFKGYDAAQREAEMNAARDSRRNSYDAARTQRFQQGEQTFEQRQQDARDARQYRQSERYVPNVRPGRPLIVSNVPRPGTQPPPRSEGRRSPDVQWNNNWRHDNRYDWHNYRNHHRSLFHFGFYYDPYGWGYQPFSIGWRLWPGYYDSQFWINDPWMYRLPYAPPGYVWVRYWNDALLVDTWSGTVVDMIPGFFW